MAMSDDQRTMGRLRIGCAMWAHGPWRERYGMPAGGEIGWYGQRFTTVEGNTTFYGLPSTATVDRWAEHAPASVRFCFKLPRHITHERRLRNVSEQLTEFFSCVAPLADRMGPVQIQLPASFAPADVGVLINFLDEVVGKFHGLDSAPNWAVEVRHRDFAAGGETERPLNDALAARGVDRVILDSRALFAAAPTTKEEHEAWKAKPRLPVRPVATGRQPMVRLIGQADPDASLEIWRRWVPKLVEWVDAGISPHVFVHTPDNAAAPELAVRLWRELDSAASGRLGPILDLERPEPPNPQLPL